MSFNTTELIRRIKIAIDGFKRDPTYPGSPYIISALKLVLKEIERLEKNDL